MNMKKTAYRPRGIFCAAQFLLFALATGMALAQSEMSITVIGDTTAANHSNPALGWGWGQYLEAQLRNVKVSNFATPGRSTKTFLDSPVWKKTLSTPADYWLIQFGANDGRKGDERFTEPSGEFKDNLRRMISDCRGEKAKPILVAPPQVLGSDRKTPQGSLTPSIAAIREVAEEDKIPLIDLYDWTGQWYQEVGAGNLDTIFVENSTAYFTTNGAEQIAHYVATRLSGLIPQIQLAEKSRK